MPALRARGQSVRRVREPGGADLPERVRALLLDPALTIADRAELLLFSAARAQLVEEVIRPALASGETVIADRFYDSTTAYQGGGRGLADEAWLDAFHGFVTAAASRPARTYCIDVPLATAAARRAGQRPDRMEASGEVFYRRVRMAYLALAARQSQRIVVLDGTLAPEALHAQILTDFDGLA